jgi:DnaJ-class molecular chaperone
MSDTEDILRAVRTNTARKIKCAACVGSGTRYSRHMASRVCEKCAGRGYLVEVPRAPLLLKATAEWAAYFDGEESSK